MSEELGESQQALADLAKDLFANRVDVARIDKVEVSAERFDRETWSVLAGSGLLGVTVPEADGGLGFGAVEAALVLEQWGRCLVPVPLVATVLASGFISAHGDDAQRAAWLGRLVTGDAVMAVASPASTTTVQAVDGTLTGTAVGIAWAHVAEAVLLPVGDDVYLLDLRDRPVVERGESTAREVVVSLDLHGAPAVRVGAGAAGWLRDQARVAWAAVQAGVTAAALELTAAYTSQREQFGKPLSTFQGVALKAADAYLDTVAIRGTALQAAWALAQPDGDAALPVLTAAWWAAEAGQHCVHLTQHLHGGMGADVTYPVHRYFLWGKQIELLLGGAAALLAELGDELHDRPDAGDAVTL
jgi:alkylation response protein AidB-like acyl-CoA dehydrogenase